jgi:hypothetical protein
MPADGDSCWRECSPTPAKSILLLTSRRPLPLQLDAGNIDHVLPTDELLLEEGFCFRRGLAASLNSLRIVSGSRAGPNSMFQLAT